MSELPSWCTLVRADNPSPMTLEGTNTYVLRGAGSAGAVVVDPGPYDEAHLLAVARLGPVELVLLTHGHGDHSDGAGLLRDMTDAPVASADRSFCVDAEPLVSGAVVEAGGLSIRVLATPGHTSDSVTFAVAPDEPALLTGDTILGRGTTVVAHPDGRLADYLDSLTLIRDLRAHTGTFAPALDSSDDVAPSSGFVLLPGHGPPGGDAGERASAYLAHRAKRLDAVRAALAAGATTPGEVVRRVYADVDENLWPAAELSVRAQLDYLAATTSE